MDVPGIDPGLDQVPGYFSEDVGLVALAVEFVHQGKYCGEPRFILSFTVESGNAPCEVENFFFCRFDELA